MKDTYRYRMVFYGPLQKGYEVLWDTEDSFAISTPDGVIGYNKSVYPFWRQQGH